MSQYSIRSCLSASPGFGLPIGPVRWSTICLEIQPVAPVLRLNDGFSKGFVLLHRVLYCLQYDLTTVWRRSPPVERRFHHKGQKYLSNQPKSHLNPTVCPLNAHSGTCDLSIAEPNLVKFDAIELGIDTNERRRRPPISLLLDSCCRGRMKGSPPGGSRLNEQELATRCARGGADQAEKYDAAPTRPVLRVREVRTGRLLLPQRRGRWRVCLDSG